MSNKYKVLTGSGDFHSSHESYRDAVDQADMIHGSVAGNRDAWKYAVAQQGFEGGFPEWELLDDEERAEYEDGAAGIGTA